MPNPLFHVHGWGWYDTVQSFGARLPQMAQLDAALFEGRDLQEITTRLAGAGGDKLPVRLKRQGYN